MDEYLEKYCCITKINTIKLSYKWEIHNFSDCTIKTEKFLQSPNFSSLNNSEYQWYLTIYPNGESEKNKDYLSLYLFCRKDEPNIDVNIKFCILDHKKEEVLKKEATHHYEKCEGYGFHSFVRRSYLLNSENNLLPDDKLTVVCYLKAYIGSKNLENKILGNIDESRCQEICKDIKGLLDDKKLTDIIIETNGKQFHAHKAILAARSPVFQAMLEHDMKERTENKIEIIEFNYEILNEMLRYVYTGDVENIEKHSCDLLAVADKYALLGLKDQCANYLCNNVTIKTALEFLELADCYNCQKLKDQTIDFIITHKKDIIVIESSEFKSFKTSNPNLAIDLLSIIVDKSL